MSLPKVLFVVEGNTDIRFVTGLSEISDLTMAVPAVVYRHSDLKDRILASGADVNVDQIPGRRLQFQAASLRYLLRRAKEFDLILCQEVLRGAFNGTLAGLLTNTPVFTYMGISPLEYFRCRRERRQIGPIRAWLGETVIRCFMTFNGKCATKSLVMGEYLKQVASHYSKRVEIGLYYGVDTALYCPVSPEERAELRRKHALPADKFVVFLSSRISHEKDPESVLRATALSRKRGLDAVVINLGGGFKDFLKLAAELELDNPSAWVLGRSAAHPMKDLPEYYQASDCVVQASLAEGLGISPLEALACGVPAVCTAVGGLAGHLNGFARMVPKQAVEQISEQFLWIASHPEEARAQALAGREYVAANWSRKKAFEDLAALFREAVGEHAKIAEGVG
jgi:glycosyltransferase involved in cell wall biosynthesis